MAAASSGVPCLIRYRYRPAQEFDRATPQIGDRIVIYYRPIIERMRDRHGRRRGSALAAVEIARRLSEAIWWMLTHDQPFAPAGALCVSDRSNGPLSDCATGASSNRT
jgi:hypothetical protein